MDGRGRDNLIVERLWRSLKYGSVYFNAYESESVASLRLQGIVRMAHHCQVRYGESICGDCQDITAHQSR